MSPEQARGEPRDYRSDLFSLGSVLYALCTGHPPFGGETTAATLKAVREDVPPPLDQVNPRVPDWLGAGVARLQAKAPGDRFASAHEVADLLGSRLARVQREPPAAPVRPTRPTRWLLVALLIGLLGLLALLAVWTPWRAAGPRSGGEPSPPGFEPLELLAARTARSASGTGQPAAPR
jgi:serine/threonine protein kinase